MLLEDSKKLNPIKSENRGPVLIIGNGPSVFEAERGDEIDEFKGKIARCNDYKIDGYEKYIGTRTNIYAVSFSDEHENMKKDYEFVLLYQSHPDGGAGLRLVRSLNKNNLVGFFPFDALDILIKKIHLTGRVQPTVGMMAIFWLMTTGYQVYLYGFDFFNKGLEYFSKSITKENRDSVFKHHDPRKEELYVNWLIEQKKIKLF
jgi:hypothetical protein